MDLATVDDVAMLLDALGKGTAENAARAMDARLDTVDLAHRKRDLSGDPLHARYCV